MPEAPSGIPVRNVWYLLLYAWDLARYRDKFAGGVEQSPNLLALLARVLCDVTEPLVRRKIGREFDQTERTIRTVRGRICMRESMTLLARRTLEIHCQFNELTVDTPRNRLIKATLHRLAGEPRLAAAATTEQTSDLRRRLRQRAGDMEHVTLGAVDAHVLTTIQLGRNDGAYELPIAICRLIHQLRMPTEDASDHAFAALLRDEITFYGLFERFLRNFFRVHLDGWTSRREQLSWPLGEEIAFWPGMETDVTLENTDGTRRIVLDAKFYKEALSSGPHSGKPKLHSSHLYQLYAYLRTQEGRRGSRFEDAAGLLVYPAVRWQLDEVVTIQGHRMGAMTVDLARPWPDIHAALMGIPARLSAQ